MKGKIKLIVSILTVVCFCLCIKTVIYATGSSECTHKVYSTNQGAKYHYGYCDKCGKCNSRTEHYANRLKQNGEKDTHYGYCACGKYMGQYRHYYRKFEIKDDRVHIAECPCGYKTTVSHNWVGGDVSAHECEDCGHIHSKANDATKGRHFFDIDAISRIGDVADCLVCGATLTTEYAKSNVLSTLPAKEEYTMVGNPNPMKEKSVKDDQYIITNFMPINDLGEIIPLNKNSLVVRRYTLGNYYRHYSQLTVNALEMISENLKYSENQELLNYITQKLQSIGSLGGVDDSKKEEVIREIIDTVSGDKDLSVVDAESIINVVSKMGDFAVKAIKVPLLNWFEEELEVKDTWLKGNVVELRNEYNGDWNNSANRKYTLYFSELKDGRYEIVASKLLTHDVTFDIFSYSADGFTDLLYSTLFVKGDGSKSEDTPSDILSYVSIGYRDTNGRVIYNKNGKLATPSDATISSIVYSGTSERKVVNKITAKMEWTQLAGYRYKGYLVKYGNEKSGYYGLYNVPSSMTVTSTSTVSVTSSFTTEGLGISVVFYFEPVEIISVKHKVNNTLINTNKNEKNILLPSVTNYDLSEETYVPKAVTSLNKNFWPGYILTGYSIYKNSETNANLLAKKTFDVNTTTKINSVNDAKRKVTIYTSLSKDLELEYDLKKEETLGYGSDKIIVFEYMYPEVEIKNTNYTSGAVIKDVNSKDITYTIKLDGDNMLVKSLDTTKVIDNNYKELKVKTSTGTIKEFKYDASDYALVQVWIYTKDLNKNTKSLYKVVVGDERLKPASVDQSKIEVADNLFSFTEGYILNTEELITVMNSVWSDLYIEFKYYKGGNILDASYIDEENNVLMMPDRYKFVAGIDEIKVPAYDITGYKLIKYSLDGTVNNNVDGLRNVNVNDNGTDRKIVFVYKKDNSPDEPIEHPIEPYAIIRSNDYGDEEYDVEVAIPTNEDLYANVVTESYIIENVTSIVNQTQKVNIVLKKKYYTSSNDDDNMITSNIAVATATKKIEYELEYSYTGGSNYKLFIIDDAVIENEAVIDTENYSENGKVLINADYDIAPYVTFIKGGKLQVKDNKECVLLKEKDGVYYLEIMLDGIDYSKPDINALAEKYQSDHVALDRIIRKNSVVNGDYLSVTAEGEEEVYLDGYDKFMAADRIPNIEELIATKYYNSAAKAPLVNNRVLFEDRNIYTYEKKENALYPSTLVTVTYARQNMVAGEDESENERVRVYTQSEIKMNNINIYTPIVNTSSIVAINENGENDNQLIDQTKTNVLTLDSMFTVRIPNDGEDYYSNVNGYSYPGYGTKDYNYKGNALEDELEYVSKGLKASAFAKEKLVKFSFDVYAVKYSSGKVVNKKLILKNTWYNLSTLGESIETEDYKFIVPIWVKDNEEGHISVRVVAENIPDSYNARSNSMEPYYSYDDSNAKDKYVLQKDFDVFIVGKLYDLQIRDSDDPGWISKLVSALTIGNESADKNMFLPIGQSNQNKFTGYMYGLKLGYRFFFDLKTKGTASDEITIEPEIYYVSENGGVATKDISIFYDDLDKKYIKLSTENDVDIKITMSNTHGEVNNSDFVFELIRGKLNNTNQVYNYAINIGKIFAGLILKEKDVKLPFDNISELTKLYGYGSDANKFVNDAKTSGAITDENSIRNCTGHWYGEYYLPASTKVVLDLNATSENILKNEVEVMKDGYLIVVFKSINAKDNGSQYLSYDNPLDNSRWEKEGASYSPYEVNLPNGKIATINDFEEGVAMAIYEVDLTARDDYESEGTH